MRVDVRANLQQVLERVAAAAARAGRRPEEIKLVAVTKGVPVEVMKEALAAGVKAFGENRAQELAAKYPLFPPGVEWHFIGHLQTNKVKQVMERACLIHSLDSWRLALEISKRAKERGKTVPVLVQVNVSGEKTKYGLAPGEVKDFLLEVSALPGIAVRGLMTIAPLVDDPEEARPVFRELCRLAARLRAELPAVDLELLSMGMSNDYTVAVEEGANIIRVGSAIFGPREN